MKNMKSFTVKSSGRVPDQYYIDCDGSYEISMIAELADMEAHRLEEIYSSFEAKLDKNKGVYYFPSRNQAVSAIKALQSYFSKRGTGKVVFLSFEEMEYIRQALINEGSNIINVKNDLKRGIFDKFN